MFWLLLIDSHAVRGSAAINGLLAGVLLVEMTVAAFESVLSDNDLVQSLQSRILLITGDRRNYITFVLL